MPQTQKARDTARWAWWVRESINKRETWKQKASYSIAECICICVFNCAWITECLCMQHCNEGCGQQTWHLIVLKKPIQFFLLYCSKWVIQISKMWKIYCSVTIPIMWNVEMYKLLINKKFAVSIFFKDIFAILIIIIIINNIINNYKIYKLIYLNIYINVFKRNNI